MSTREWGLGYDEGYEKGWNDAMDQKPSQQEPVAWNVIDPTGKIVATEKNAIRGWARIQGYKPTVEGLLGFHEQGWRVVPTTLPQRTWVGLVQGVRVDGDTVVIKVKNGNDAARELCGALIEEINK